MVWLSRYLKPPIWRAHEETCPRCGIAFKVLRPGPREHRCRVGRHLFRSSPVLLKRVSSSVANVERVECPAPGSVFELNPAIFEFLTCSKWDDGAPRKLGTLTLFFEAGRWKAWVNDKDGSRSACVTASSVEDLVVNIESGLMSGSLDWRAARPSVQSRSR